MIAIKIELWPRGDQARARVLGRILIRNDETGTQSSGNYEALLSKHGKASHLPWKSVMVVGFSRRSLNAYHLLHRVLSAALGQTPLDFPSQGEQEGEDIDL